MKSLLVAALLAGSAAAQASVVSFDDLALGGIAGDSLTVTVDGVDVTFTGTGLTVRDFSFYGVGYALSTESDAGPITITFGGGELSDYVAFSNPLNNTGGEIDAPAGSAYDQWGGLLNYLESSDPVHYMVGPGIAKVIYAEGTPGEGFVMGDFQFGAVAVPEPETYLLMAMGLLALGLRRRNA